MLDEKVALKKIIQICSNFGTLSMHVILLSISGRILMNSSFFVRLFSTRDSFWTVNKLEIFSGFQQGIVLPSCIILIVGKGYKKVNTVAVERVVLNS